METLFETKMTKGFMEALVKWQENKPDIKFDANNPHFKSKYASLAGIIKAIKAPLSECGITYVHTVVGGRIWTLLMHPETEGQLVAERPLPDSGTIQNEGSVITYQKRYQLAALLGIAGEEDTDGNNATATSLPRATKKQVEGAITNVEKGMASGNRQVIDLMRANYQIDTAQLRELFEAEYFHFEERMTALMEKMENAGYDVKKTK